MLFYKHCHFVDCFLLVLLILIAGDAVLLLTNATEQQCPSECNCHLKSVDCSYRRLTAVPKNFPINAERIDLRGNEIETLGRDDLAGLAKLKILLLNDNRISRIDAGVFDHVTSLQRIRLNRNQLQTLDDGLFANLKNLERLDLSENSLTSVGPRTLEGLENLINLQIDDNKLACVSPKVISKMANIEILTMSNNNMTTIPEGLLNANQASLRMLRLNDNPLHCNCGTSWLVDWLHNHVGLGPVPKCKTPVELSGQLLTHTTEHWADCSSNTELRQNDLVFNREALKKCVEPPKCPVGCNCNGPVVSCEGPDIRQILAEELPVDMVELRINRARMNELPDLMFSKFEQLRSLEISDSFLRVISPAAFSGLKNLRSLTLYGNKLEDLPENVFSELSSLETLYLNNNQLRCLRSRLFVPLKKLRILSLFDNQLASIANGTFESLANLNILHLGQNPFICDCNLKWLFDFLQSRPALEKTNVRCDAPARTRRKRVLTAGSDTFECRTRGEYLRTAGAGECRIEPGCPEACRCDDMVVDCSGVGFTDAQVLPPFFKIPSYTQVVDFSDNNLMQLPAHLLVNTDVRRLYLRQNQFSAITRTAFTVDPANVLTELDLSNNEIASIERGSFDSFQHLTKLVLDGNKLPCLSNETFSALLSKSLVSLSVADNQIRCIRPLGPVYIGDTPMALGDFNFSGNPLQCDCQMKEFVSWLQTVPALKLGNFSGQCLSPRTMSALEVPLLQPEQMICQNQQSVSSCKGRKATSGKVVEQCCPADLILPEDELKKTSEGLANEVLDISEVMCDSPSVCPPECTCQNSIVRCSSQGLTAIPDDLPTDTTDLYLDHNNITLLNFSALSYLKSLKRLDLSYNQIAYLGGSGLLGQNEVEIVETSSLSANRMQLDSLILNFNAIQCMHTNAFAGLDNLRLLLLHGNDVSTLPLGLFDPVPRLQLLGLGQNPLYCDCNLKWLSETVKKSFIESGIATCQGPAQLAGKLLLTADSSNFVCSGSSVPTEVAAKCDPCRGVTCNNAGKCRPGSKGYPDFTCECQSGFSGHQCETKLDACYARPCLNGATCRVLDDFGKFSCSCPPGFEGDRCEININDCAGNRCENGASCRDLVQSYECICIPGFTGKYCQRKIDFCESVVNPCQNGATCIDDFTDYRCLCVTGFAGRNCSNSVLDCRERPCANNGQCALIDAITSRFSCRCADGFGGDFCENAQPDANLYRIGKIGQSTCKPNTCRNSGRCLEKPGTTTGFGCECLNGYTGRTCEKVHMTGFSSRDGSYARLLMPALQPSLNLTVVLSTLQNKGVLLFAGEADHFFSVEIFEGYAKASFFIGNYQMSTGFSYLQVADGTNHTLEVTIIQRSMTLRVDDGLLHTVRNDGPNEVMNVKPDEPLFIGGLPRDRGIKEAAAFRIRDTTSFDGCIVKLYVNGELVDFENQRFVAEKFAIKPGCRQAEPPTVADILDATKLLINEGDASEFIAPSLLMSDSRRHSCNRLSRSLNNSPPCSGNGQCIAARNGSTFVCSCKVGYSGRECETAPTCSARDESKPFVDENGCKSRKPIRQRVCSGSCGNACCKPSKIKTRRVRLICPDGKTYTKQVPVVKKCGCVQCNALSKRLRRVSFWDN